MINDLGLELCEPSALEILEYHWSMVELPDIDFSWMYTDAYGDYIQYLDGYFDQFFEDMAFLPDAHVTLGELEVLEYYSDME